LSEVYAEKLQRDKDEKARNRELVTATSNADIIRFLARQNISFRGRCEGDGSANRGNFLEMAHLMAKYNPV